MTPWSSQTLRGDELITRDRDYPVTECLQLSSGARVIKPFTSDPLTSGSALTDTTTPLNMATASLTHTSVWPSSLGTYEGPYPESQHTQGVSTGTTETSFTELFAYLGKLWQTYQSGTVS